MTYTRLKRAHTFQNYAQSIQIAVNNNKNCCASRRVFGAHGLFGGQQKTLKSIVKKHTLGRSSNSTKLAIFTGYAVKSNEIDELKNMNVRKLKQNCMFCW